MVANFSLSPGRLVVRDTNGDITLDTDERNFIGKFYSGQIIVPQRQASSVSSSRTDVNIDADTVLETIPADFDTILGAFKVTVTGYTPPLADGGWFQATGSYMAGQFIINDSGNAGPNGLGSPPFNFVSGIVLYTFRAQGGQLIFNERSWIRCTLSLGGTTITSTMPATTIDYKLYAGSLD